MLAKKDIGPQTSLLHRKPAHSFVVHRVGLHTSFSTFSPVFHQFFTCVNPCCEPRTIYTVYGSENPCCEPRTFYTVYCSENPCCQPRTFYTVYGSENPCCEPSISGTFQTDKVYPEESRSYTGFVPRCEIMPSYAIIGCVRLRRCGA